MSDTKKSFSPDWATHPGEHIREYLDVWQWTQGDLARAANFSRGEVSDLLSGKRSVTPAIALKLEATLGLAAHVWLGLQANWDLHELRRREIHGLTI